MPIETPTGTLEVENAKFRASSVEATIAVGIGTDSNDAYPLQIFKETAPDIRLSEGTTLSSAARFYSNNSNLYIQTGTDFTSGSSGDVAFQTMGGQSTHMVIKSDGNVGVGTTDPNTNFQVADQSRFNVDVSDATYVKVGNRYSSADQLSLISAGDIAICSDYNANSTGKNIDFRTNTDTNGGTLLMRIQDDGNVGIGTASPATYLHLSAKNSDPGGTEGDFVGTHTLTEYMRFTSLGDTGDVNAVSVGFKLGGDDNSDASPYGRLDICANDGASAGNSYGQIPNNTIATFLGGGNVGIGVTSPSYKLHVDGNFILDATVSSGGIVMSSESGNDTSIDDRTGYGGSSFAYCLRTTLYTSTASGRTYYFGLLDNDNSHFTLAMVGGGAPEPDPILMIDTASRLYVGEIWVAGIKQHSDDRIKYNEEHITGATGTLMKLKPQKYDKYLNLSAHDTDANAYTIESGFIAQDVYYDTPELRHLVSMARDATPSDTKPETPEDITQDPDYSDWGTKKATVDYTGFIPYIVRAIQENEETKGKVRARLPVSNVSDYSGLVVCSTDTPGEVALSTKHKDKRCFGVVSDVPGFVNTSGEGRVWVLGDIEAGDFITTSNVLPGYAMRQDSDFLMNYTLAKVTHVTDAPLKRVRQELSNVTYFMTTTYEEIDEKEWSTLPEDKRTTKEVMGYYEIDTDKEITIRDYNNLEEEKRQRYIQKPKTLYYFTKRQESKYSREGSVSVVRQELVNVLDEHGQLQWEDDPSGSAHKIRYLDADGNITDEANHVHKAAFVGCTYHCG